MAPSDQFVKSAWMLGSIAVVVAALYLAKGVLVPLTLAVLLSFLLSPLCDWLERRSLGRVPAVLVTAILGFARLGARGLDGGSANVRPGPKNARVSGQPASQASCGE